MDELRGRADLERLLQVAQVDAVVVERDPGEGRAAALQQQQRAVVGRLLDDHPVAGLNRVLEEEDAGLQRAVGHHHLRRVHAVELRDPLAEPGMAPPGAVRERPLPVRLQGAGRRLTHELARQDVGAGSAASEADYVGGHGPASLDAWTLA